MDSFETTLFQPDNYHLLSWPSPAARINQWKKPSGLDSPLSWLSKTRKSVVTFLQLGSLSSFPACQKLRAN